MAAAAAANTRAFLTFVQRALVLALQARPGSTVLTDNFACHEAAGIGHRYPPPACSPAPNLTEQARSKP